MTTNRLLIVGGAFGLCVCLLAVLTAHHGHGRFVVMLPVILAQPVRLIVPLPPASLSFAAVLMPLVLGLEYALLGWSLAVMVRTVRKARHPLLVTAVIACVLVGGYAATWASGAQAVRAEIQRQRSADYPRLKERSPEWVSSNPQLRVFYCLPVLPFVVACEYDYVYGPMAGWGEGDLWLWRLTDAKTFCQYGYWDY